ncbi:hypothetical protein GYMLUDRAFT_37876 [Collybiopsis luxurians FD-317 M1]|nr:hypothetical protein GYMLUDRAFT_37876 [Collybiopsis luxurians FD-317 M1]
MSGFTHSLEEDPDDIEILVEKAEPIDSFTEYPYLGQHNSGELYSENSTQASMATNHDATSHIHTIGSYSDGFVAPVGFDSLSHSSPLSSPHSSPLVNGSPFEGDSLLASMDSLELGAAAWNAPSSARNLTPGHPNVFLRLQVPPPDLHRPHPSSAHSEHSYLFPSDTATHHSPSSPNPPFLSVDSAHWQPRGRRRSHSDSASYAPYPLSQRSRSPSVSSYTSELSDRGSIVSEASSFEHIDPQLLLTRIPTNTSSSGYSSYSAESTGSNMYSLAQAESNPSRNPQVASRKTRLASAKRRRKEARFHCSVPGCGGSFTARHNLLNHENAHNGVRKYGCGSCGNAFVTSAVLKRHAKTCKGKN